jgi:hypothetical protein
MKVRRGFFTLELETRYSNSTMNLKNNMAIAFQSQSDQGDYMARCCHNISDFRAPAIILFLKIKKTHLQVLKIMKN